MFTLGRTVLDTTKDDTVEIVAILEDSFPTVYVVYDGEEIYLQLEFKLEENIPDKSGWSLWGGTNVDGKLVYSSGNFLNLNDQNKSFRYFIETWIYQIVI